MEGMALRYGFFYGPGTWFHPDGDVAQQVRQQQFPIVGNGEGVWSWLHIEDAAIATVAAAEQGNPGGSDVHVMFALRRSSREVVVANKQLDGTDMVRELLGKR